MLPDLPEFSGMARGQEARRVRWSVFAALAFFAVARVFFGAAAVAAARIAFIADRRMVLTLSWSKTSATSSSSRTARRPLNFQIHSGEAVWLHVPKKLRPVLRAQVIVEIRGALLLHRVFVRAQSACRH
ncbi:MAG: hypothetical protein ACXW4P_07750 [Thermoanaerobaculia bacterium]